MKERKFWRIYFLLVNSHVAPYEKKYMEQAEVKAAEQEKADRAKEQELAKGVSVSKPDGAQPAKPLQNARSSTEQDLDVFLLGDLGDSDEGPDDEDDVGLDDDFDKIGESSIEGSMVVTCKTVMLDLSSDYSRLDLSCLYNYIYTLDLFSNSVVADRKMSTQKNPNRDTAVPLMENIGI
ncbi:hypothetical protein KSS87_012151 [Heliosperma pusillum]|nr:hypothetical protein KSS87_012151 [Heliosperma pusillum]